MTPGSDPESASSFLRGASPRRSGHPVCGPWRSAARNWRWPCPARRTQQARTPRWPVRAKLGHAILLARSDSAFFEPCRAAIEYARAPKQPQSPLYLAVPICSKLAWIQWSVPVASLRGDTAEILVRNLVADVHRSQKNERELRKLLVSTLDELLPSAHRQVATVPGIGPSTAAILVAKIVDIDRFATPGKLVSYFGAFPEEHSSGVDKKGNPLPLGARSMSTKGNDLVRSHLWNGACVPFAATRPFALYRRLRAKGKRGDVAMGHCIRKLLHLVFAVWKTDRPFDPNHFHWDGPSNATSSTATTNQPAARPPSANKEAVGHKQDSPAKKVVATASITVAPTARPVKQVIPTSPLTRPRVDFAFLRQQVSMQEVLKHLCIFDRLRGAASNAEAIARCTATLETSSQHSQSIWERRRFSVFMRTVGPRETCWTYGRQSITSRCTKPLCILLKPSRSR